MMKKIIKPKKAFPPDAPEIKSLVNGYAEKGWMLPRSLSETYENIRDFWVVREKGKIIGCAALHVCWEDMAEIRSLAVAGSEQNKGWGKVLLRQCLKEASDLGMKRVFTLTFLPRFFEKLGFIEINKEALPHKVWKDCLNCPHFPDCKEVALIYKFEN